MNTPTSRGVAARSMTPDTVGPPRGGSPSTPPPTGSHRPGGPARRWSRCCSARPARRAAPTCAGRRAGRPTRPADAVQRRAAHPESADVLVAPRHQGRHLAGRRPAGQRPAPPVRQRREQPRPGAARAGPAAATRYRRAYAGLLCTVDMANDPIRVYEALLAEEPPRIDFLLRTPPGTAARRAPTAAPPLRATGCRRSTAGGSPTGRRCRCGCSIPAVGRRRRPQPAPRRSGLDPADLVVVETDGAWEQADSLKTAYDGAAGTGMDVFTPLRRRGGGAPGIAAASGARRPRATCRACPVVDQCGGGLTPTATAPAPASTTRRLLRRPRGAVGRAPASRWLPRGRGPRPPRPTAPPRSWTTWLRPGVRVVGGHDRRPSRASPGRRC